MPRRSFSRLFRPLPILVILSLLSLLLASCSKVTSENYRKIQIGMTYPQITRLLGEPAACDSVLNAKTCSWNNADKAINIEFVADKVVFFSSSGL